LCIIVRATPLDDGSNGDLLIAEGLTFTTDFSFRFAASLSSVQSIILT